MKTQIIIATVIASLFGLSTAYAGSCSATSSCSAIPAQHAHKEVADIVHTAKHAGQFSTLVAALQAADLVDALQAEGPFTVFAPTDEAFAKLPAETLNALLQPENKAQLQSILTYHVVAGKVTSTDLIKATQAKTLQGDKVDLALVVNNAKVVKADIKASNGVIHVIDSVILPDQAQPIDGHDRQHAQQASSDIVQTAQAAGQFSTLISALQAAGLVDALQGDGPFTVFAPTDAAFAKLPAGTLESLTQPENAAQLQAILKYHVLPAKVSSSDIVPTPVVKTLQGQPLYPSVLVDSASIKTKNIYCRNGVIHIIDEVILPAEQS